MPKSIGKPSGWSILATVAAWLIAALCLVLCAVALVLWETDLAIRRALPEMGYNEILKLRDDAWRPFRAPVAWALVIMSIGTALVACLPALFMWRLVRWIPAAIAAVVSLGTLGYVAMTR